MAVIIAFVFVLGFGVWDSGVIGVKDGVGYNPECWNQSCGSQWNDLVGTNRGN